MRLARRASMPTDFLSAKQIATYVRLTDPPSRTQLERYFILDDADQALIARRRRPHTQLGFALQLGPVRLLESLLTDPLDVPRRRPVSPSPQTSWCPSTQSIPVNHISLLLCSS